MQLNFWKVVIAWPIYFFLQFRIRWVFYRLNHQKSNKRRTKERQRYLFVRRYSKIFHWFYSAKVKKIDLDNWKFESTVLLVKTTNPSVPLFFAKVNDFKKTAPLSFCFTEDYLQLLPTICKQFCLLLNHFILNEHNITPALKKQLLINLQIPRTLLVIAPNGTLKITNFIADLLGSGIPALHFVRGLKSSPNKLNLIESYNSRQMLRINQQFLEKKVYHFFH